jgi:hypothetical protein
MDEAKVLIDLKEGIIELQGPVDFVRHYLELYRPAIKGFRGQAAPAAEKRSAPRGRKRASSRAGKGKTVTGTRAILNDLEAGFFDEPRATGEVKKRLDETGLSFTDNNVRGSLRRLVQSGALGATGKGTTLRYQRAGQP